MHPRTAHPTHIPTHSPSGERRATPPTRRRWLPALAVTALTVAVLLTMFTAGEAVAQPPPPPEPITPAPSLEVVLNNLRNWIMGVLVLLATVFFTIGGVRYLMASGDPGQIAKAKDMFLTGALGFALAVLAPLVVEILKGIVSA